jgi:hypothetical protein
MTAIAANNSSVHWNASPFLTAMLWHAVLNEMYQDTPEFLRTLLKISLRIVQKFRGYPLRAEMSCF